ncbi:MAG: DNA repair protein RecN [Selenomonadaceae bacterium]|nr:DNA repair protein RecN [Selenomonadaceae bacterium]
MLKSLTVQNFALIEKIELEFDKGLNILTGETGAGKSILIDALGAALGNRANTSQIRAGCDEFCVEAVFLPEKNSAVKILLKEFDIEEDDSLIIKRKVNRAGKNSILVNGSHVTLSVLKKIGAALVDIHGQSENLSLLKPEKIYSLIGGDDKISAVLADYQKIFRSWKKQVKALAEKEKSKSEHDERLEMLRWQEQEISAANLQPHEDEELETELRKLSNAEKISSHVEESRVLLGNGEEFDILTALAKVQKNLIDVAKYDEKINSVLKFLDDAEINLREAYDEIRAYSDAMDFSPEILDRLNERKDVIFKLKKYGANVDEILKRLEKIRADINAIENFDSDVESTRRLIEKLETLTKKRAATLMQLRKDSADALGAAIEKEIRRLGMKNATFFIGVAPADELTENGGDMADIFFSANIGEEAASLSKVVSGGELSRIALAIKTVSAGREDSASTMIFDEIDAGLGGTTAKVVAECIDKVSRAKQVLCVTHLAQIACMADVHLHIEKSEKGTRTVTGVEKLAADERVTEIARMASGSEIPAAIQNARAMLNEARKLKRARKI